MPKKQTAVTTKAPRSLELPLRLILIIGGIIGLICAFIITVDKIKLLENPAFRPNCDLNPVISCGSVMQSAQSNAFGFPNPFIGLAAFAVLITIGAGMYAGARYARWFWLALEAGAIFGVLFVHWLFFQSTYHINALCPYCIVVWIVTITTFWYVTLYNIEKGYIAVKGKTASVAGFVRKHHLDLLVLWLLIIGGLILSHFWYYYGQYFS